ncbi:MAG: hypothetical protein A2Y10_11160 [Planctomycetes bacterium GWF2_41_51]|nr:MAG: hypothetical protein A2Y10_11160 [Planctomycetes bacterium GWF2_41_51]HBG28392.1 hypothetical protein [Phycisphaerales bacterium]
MNRDPALYQSFVKQARKALSDHPQIKHEWSIDEDEDHCILDIPEMFDEGFAIKIEVNPDRITVIASGAHMTLNLNEYKNADELAAQALGLVRDLLSPGMRIRERLAGGIPYKWAFETYQNGRWLTMEWIGLIFWNYFGKRTEKIYQNKVLPARK